MDESNIIICENCYEENESTRTTCKNCGAKLYHNNNESYADTQSKSTNNNTKNYQRKQEYIDSSNSSNRVASKFTLVVTIVKFIGYIGAIIVAIVMMSIDEDMIGLGILIGIAVAIATWFSTLFFEAIAEGLNLLQDIKNKLK